MTLQEKFGKLFMKGRNTTEFEKIADDFAIEFSEWVWGNCFNIFNDRFNYKDDEYSLKELLTIYKKPKQL